MGVVENGEGGVMFFVGDVVPRIATKFKTTIFRIDRCVTSLFSNPNSMPILRGHHIQEHKHFSSINLL